VPESESEQREAQVNLIEVAEDSNQSSEAPSTSFCPRRQAPVHDPSVSIYATTVLFTCAFKFIGVDWNPSYMILGTYVMNTRIGSSSRCSANRFRKSRVVSCHS
jgi:hypothetical protein